MEKSMRLPWCIVAGGFFVTASAAELQLVQEGKPAVVIAVPAVTEHDAYLAMPDADAERRIMARFPNADAARLTALKLAYKKHREAEVKRVGDEEKLAVEELKTYLAKISGATLEVVTVKQEESLPGGPAILIGRGLAEKAGLGAEVKSLHQDGLLLKVVGNKLVLTGCRARGTLYAVYEFLESLGCRWVMPGEFGEVVPATKTIATIVDKRANPSHAQRYWWCTGGNSTEYPRWTLRNKGNFVKAIEDQTIAQGHALASPLAWGARNTPRAIKVKEMVRVPKKGADGKVLLDVEGKPQFEMVEQEVPGLPDEYYAMHDGRPAKHTPNMSNPKVWDLYAEHYLEYFTNTAPFADYVSISAEDGFVLDERPETRQYDSNEYDAFMGAFSATDRLWFFHNRNIAKVSAKLAGRKYGVLVYANNMTPPRVETVNPAMALVFAPLGICPLHHVRDEGCKTNRGYRKWLEAWMSQAQAAGAETHYYDYLPIGFQWSTFIISPQWGIIGRNYPWFHSLGLEGHTTQGFDDFGAMGLTAWVAIRLYWDVDQDYNDLVREYCGLRYGRNAAAAMHSYYKVFERRMDTVPDLCSNEVWGNHLAIDAETRAKAREALAQAHASIGGERENRQYQAACDFQRAMDAWCDGIEHARDTGDFAAAAAKMEPAFEIAAKLNALYSHFINPTNIDKKNNAQFSTGGWLKKYLAWDGRIKAAKASAILPRTMKIALDTDNTAAAKGWHNPDVSVAGLEDWDCTVVPDVKYKTERDVAAFFYRTEVDVPASFQGAERVVLYFPSLIARSMRVWVNGQPVVFDLGGSKDEIWRGPSYFWYDYDHQRAFDVTPHIKPGQRNTIAFRVFKSFDHGGSYDRIFLLAESP
jgi:hypothetical protein